MPDKIKLTDPELAFLRIMTDPERKVRGGASHKETDRLQKAVGLNTSRQKQNREFATLFNLDTFDKTPNPTHAAVLKAIHSFGMLIYLTRPALARKSKQWNLEQTCRQVTDSICDHLFQRHYPGSEKPTAEFIQFIKNCISASLLHAAKSGQYEKIMLATFLIHDLDVNSIRSVAGPSEGNPYKRWKDQSIDYKLLKGKELELFEKRATYLLEFATTHKLPVTRTELSIGFNQLYSQTVFHGTVGRAIRDGSVFIALAVACVYCIYKAATLGGEFNAWTTLFCTPLLLYLSRALARFCLNKQENSAIRVTKNKIATQKSLIESAQQLVCYEHEGPDVKAGFIFSQPHEAKTHYVPPTEKATSKATVRKTTGKKREAARPAASQGGGGGKKSDTAKNEVGKLPKNHYVVTNRDGMTVAIALLQAKGLKILGRGSLNITKLVTLLKTCRYEIVPTSDARNQNYGTNKLNPRSRNQCRFIGSFIGHRTLNDRPVPIFKVKAARPSHV